MMSPIFESENIVIINEIEKHKIIDIENQIEQVIINLITQ
jgi:signal transduction histidine kinase